MLLAQEQQILPVAPAKALELRGREVVRFRLPQAQHLPGPRDFPAAGAETLRNGWQALGYAFQVESEVLRVIRAAAEQGEGLLLERVVHLYEIKIPRWQRQIVV